MLLVSRRTVYLGMKKMKNKIKILCGAVAMVIAGQVSATTDWGLTVGSVSAGGATVTSTGWADTGTGTPRLLEQQTAPNNFVRYDGGLGINNRDGCSRGSACDVGDTLNSAPEHALDNNQRNEMVMLSFSKSVKLTNAKFGWIGTDSDYTVMAYTGAGAPATLAGKTWGALGAGWVSIGNYSDAVRNANNSINAGNAYSSYWLIGAYNAAANPGGGNVTGTGNDYIKLFSVSGCVSGTVGCTPPGNVPEPGSLALFGLALVGLFGLRKNQSA